MINSDEQYCTCVYYKQPTYHSPQCALVMANKPRLTPVQSPAVIANNRLSWNLGDNDRQNRLQRMGCIATPLTLVDNGGCTSARDYEYLHAPTDAMTYYTNTHCR